jgi:hypothetical protein
LKASTWSRYSKKAKEVRENASQEKSFLQVREVRVQVHQGRKMLWGTDEEDVEVRFR